MLLSINSIKYKKISQIILEEVEQIKTAIKEKFVKDNKFIRSLDNNQTDISLLSVVVPFDIIDANEEIVKNTVNEIENKLKLENGGYLRYDGDAYIGGNAWIISSLWLALYYIKINNKQRAKELFDWVTEHADKLKFLPEQIERNGHNSAWVIQLSWSHAMYVIVKSELLKMCE